MGYDLKRPNEQEREGKFQQDYLNCFNGLRPQAP